MYTWNYVQDCQVKNNLLQEDSFHHQIGLTFKEETTKVMHLEQSFVGCRTWELWKADQKYTEISEMWCWRKMEKIHCTDRVRNDVLHRVKEEENITHTHTHTHTKRRKVKWIGHILRRDCLLQHVIEWNTQGTTEVTGRRGTKTQAATRWH